MASMCYFKNLQCVIRDALFVLLGLVSSGSGGFFMVVHIFWGYSLVILCFCFFMGGFASGLCCFVYQ